MQNKECSKEKLNQLNRNQWNLAICFKERCKQILNLETKSWICSIKKNEFKSLFLKIENYFNKNKELNRQLLKIDSYFSIKKEFLPLFHKNRNYSIVKKLQKPLLKKTLMSFINNIKKQLKLKNKPSNNKKTTDNLIEIMKNQIFYNLITGYQSLK